MFGSTARAVDGGDMQFAIADDVAGDVLLAAAFCRHQERSQGNAITRTLDGLATGISLPSPHHQV
jgi:hypothetical protein